MTSLASSENFWRQKPKVELHVHLGGCVRPSTLAELAKEKGIHCPCSEDARVGGGNRRTLADCFKIFSAIHGAVDGVHALRRVTQEAVRDMARDGVRFVELRTTPRTLPSDRATAADYLRTVVSAASEVIAEEGLAIDVGVVVSVDRARSAGDAAEAVALAKQFSASPWHSGHAGVVGVELSGNPHAGTFSVMRPALDFARSQASLPVSLHIAERFDKRETEEMLKWKPERVGHAVFVDSEIVDVMAAARVPVEICLTSNIFSQSIATPADHPFVGIHTKRGHPVCFCTDDPGVFETSLSREFAIAEVECGFSRSDLEDVSLASIDFSFAPSHIKHQLRAIVSSSRGE